VNAGKTRLFSRGVGLGPEDACTLPTPTPAPIIGIYLIIFNNRISINLQIGTKLFKYIVTL